MVAVTEEVARLKKEQKEAVNSLEKSLAGTRTELDALRNSCTTELASLQKSCRSEPDTNKLDGRWSINLKLDLGVTYFGGHFLGNPVVDMSCWPFCR